MAGNLRGMQNEGQVAVQMAAPHWQLAAPHRALHTVKASLAALGVLTLAFAIGCNQADPPTETGSTATGNASDAPTTARAVIDRMLKAYRDADSYKDSGQLRFRYVLDDGQRRTEDVNFSVSFQRPNKLRMHVYLANVVCDGKQIRAFANVVPDQVLSAPAPATLTQEALYTDPVLTPQLTRGIVGASIQFAMLVADDPIGPLLDGESPPSLLEPSAVEDDPCYRVELHPSFGTLVFWIDRKTFVLRRIDFPQSLGRGALGPEGETATDVSLVAEFKGAQLNGKIDEQAFQFSAPEGAKVVDQLILQPKLLGQKAPAFELSPLGGETVNRESLAGKIAVVNFWDSSCEPFLRGLPNLEAVYQKYKDNPKVVFLTVNVDGEATTDEKLREIFTKAKASVPIARDPRQNAQIAFELKFLPSLFVIGPDGTVELVEDGTVQVGETDYTADLAKQLPPLLDKLLAGQSVHEEAMRENERRQRKLSGGPAESPDTAATTAVELPKVDIPGPSLPKRLILTNLWSCRELKQPGNILVVDRRDEAPRLLVCDGTRTVVELDAAGKALARHELDIPSQAVVTYLRTAVAKDGQRRFVACGKAQQELHVFDDAFKRLLSFPAQGDHAGISDVQLADLDGDGQPELNVGYLGVVGVQNVALDGTRHWSNRSIENVFSLAASGPAASGARQLIVAAGSITPIDDRGKDGTPVRIDGRFVRWIASADLRGDGRADYCSIASIRVGMDTAVGLSPGLREAWQYELPLGVQPNAALEMIVSGSVLGQEKQWVLAGADGSIHVLAADGALVDRFNYGAAISGLAVAQLDAQPTLLVATSVGVDAWKVEAAAAQ